MSKGDTVEVTTLGGATVRVEASRAGRRVTQTEHSRNKTRWLDVSEVTRGGRETGTKVSVRFDQVVSVAVSLRDTAEAEAKQRSRRPKPPGAEQQLGLLDDPEA